MAAGEQLMTLTCRAIRAGPGTHTAPHMVAVELRASDILWEAKHGGFGARFFRRFLGSFPWLDHTGGWLPVAAWRRLGDLNFSSPPACP